MIFNIVFSFTNDNIILFIFATDIKHSNVVLYVITTNEWRKYIAIKYSAIEEISSIEDEKIHPNTYVIFDLTKSVLFKSN